MNDAYAYAMQVQQCKPNTQGVTGYVEKWFHIQLHDKNVIKGKYIMLVVSEVWYTIPTLTNKMRNHIKRVRALQEAGLTAAHVIETFAQWRIIPLKHRDLACTYSGVMDPNRESKQGQIPYPDLAQKL